MLCSMRLLQNTSRGIGDLILIYKRMTGLAGHTSRVAELLEQVRPCKVIQSLLCHADLPACHLLRLCASQQWSHLWIMLCVQHRYCWPVVI